MQARINDRRQNSVPVSQDRRRGVDRREQQQEHSSVFYALESVPTFRRAYSISDNVDKGDYIPALGLAGLAAINFKEDMRDVASACKQIYSKIDKTYHYDPLYDRKNYQHEFSFFRGTLIEKWLHKKIENGNNIANKLYEADKTIYDTKFGELVQKIFGIEKVDARRIKDIKDFQGVKARAYSFKSTVLGGEITARAMQRTTLLGVIVIGLLELPKIFKSDKKIKQAEKSAISFVSITAGIGYGGAIGSKYAGATGSLIGMGIGAILGNKLAVWTQKKL